MLPHRYVTVVNPYTAFHLNFCASGSDETNFKTKIAPLRPL